jgi:malonate-semialdehyde dehydrogenase (acetylating) / methylmalonate-semialdehyde dehydrogenase
VNFSKRATLLLSESINYTKSVQTKSEALADVAKGNETVEYAMSLPQLTQGKVLEVSRGVTCQDVRKPLGVVASIVPFNFPFMVPFWTLPIAITMGNCMILKPSEKVPLTMNRVMSLLKEAGLPDGVVNLVNGAAETATLIAEHPQIKAVTFVGTSHVAELIHKKGRQLNKRVLALGGAKNHLVAYPDCNIDMTSQDIVVSVASFCLIFVRR